MKMGYKFKKYFIIFIFLNIAALIMMFYGLYLWVIELIIYEMPMTIQFTIGMILFVVGIVCLIIFQTLTSYFKDRYDQERHTEFYYNSRKKIPMMVYCNSCFQLETFPPGQEPQICPNCAQPVVGPCSKCTNPLEYNPFVTRWFCPTCKEYR